MAWGVGGHSGAPGRVHGTVGEAMVAAVVFAVAIGVTWATHGRDGPTSGTLVGGASAGREGEINPWDLPPGVAASELGEGADPTTATTLVVDPRTGEEVVVTVPPDAGEAATTSTAPAGASGTSTTAPPATTPTSSPPTTGTPTTEPSTTTTAPPDTTTTTAPPDTTTTTAAPDPPA